jgi:hypothetical protein
VENTLLLNKKNLDQNFQNVIFNLKINLEVINDHLLKTLIYFKIALENFIANHNTNDSTHHELFLYKYTYIHMYMNSH